MTRSSVSYALVLTAALLPLAGCSESSPDDASGGAGLGGSANTAGGSLSSAGSGAAGGGGPSEVTCTTAIELQPGRNYGEYSLVAIRVDEGLAPGAYTLRGDGNGGVQVFAEDDALLGELTYQRSASVADGMLQTVVLAGFFELDVRSQTQPDLTGLDDSIFDGCHQVVAASPTVIRSGALYGSILVEAVTPNPSATSGTYTFFAESGNAGQVELRRDGEAVTTLDYDWTVTIGAGASYTFDFPDVLTLTVSRAMGTSNLFGVTASLFDGRHELIIP